MMATNEAGRKTVEMTDSFDELRNRVRNEKNLIDFAVLYSDDDDTSGDVGSGFRLGLRFG